MQQNYKVVFRIAGHRHTFRLLADNNSQAMELVKQSIIFDHCYPIEPPLNLIKRINELIAIK